MKRLWASSDGFTVLEILVSVVVVGILAAVTLVSYDGIQQRSRDAARESHVTEMKIALDKYYADNSEFPPACGADGTGCVATNLNAFLEPYEYTIPADPRYEGTADDYQYVRGAPGNSYGIRVTYEARPTCKDGVLINSTWWGVGVPYCSQSGSTIPSIATTSLPVGYLNFPYSTSINVSGSLPISFSLTSGSLPAGVTLNAGSGVISGTPTSFGTFNITVQATNAAGNDTQALTLQISAASPP